MININQRMEVRNATGYLASRIVFYLMNLHTQHRTIYFARVGRSFSQTYKSDDPLTEEGKEYATRLAERLVSFRKEERTKDLALGEKLRSLTVLPYCRVEVNKDLDFHSFKSKAISKFFSSRNNQTLPTRTRPAKSWRL